VFSRPTCGGLRKQDFRAGIAVRTLLPICMRRYISIKAVTNSCNGLLLLLVSSCFPAFIDDLQLHCPASTLTRSLLTSSPLPLTIPDFHERQSLSAVRSAPTPYPPAFISFKCAQQFRAPQVIAAIPARGHWPEFKQHSGGVCPSFVVSLCLPVYPIHTVRCSLMELMKYSSHQ
jgi:hypothetical protein